MRGYYYINKDLAHNTVCSAWDKGYRYGFNSMEKDNEINVNGGSYDFGARIYDSRLGRWLSLDPLMASYPSISPYSFAANIPILVTDPTGKVLIIKNGSEEYQYYNGKLYAKDPDGNFVVEYTPVEGDFVFNIFSSLTKLSESKKGAEVINRMALDSDNVFNISDFDEKNDENSFVPQTNTIYVNGKDHTSKSENYFSPSFIVLAHELYHGYNFIYKIHPEFHIGKGWYSIFFKNGYERKVSSDEIPATHFENMMRSYFGLPLREYYSYPSLSDVEMVAESSTSTRFGVDLGQILTNENSSKFIMDENGNCYDYSQDKNPADVKKEGNSNTSEVKTDEK
jgi:RHS repeat-associated protein